MPSSKQSKKVPTLSAQQRAVEQSMQGTFKDKQRMLPPPEPPVQTEPKRKQVQEPSPKQPVQGSSKGKKVELPIRANTKGKQPEQPRPQQPAQADPKGKQVEQPVKASLKSKQPQQASPEQSKNPAAEGKQPQKPVYVGNPRHFIARIPGDRNAEPSTMHRVKVTVVADTARRHPQTFFFKNIPNVKFASASASRIVRLERDSHPTHYFLFVFVGEFPEVISPRNDNAIFANMHEPIFGDAFVFKLADQEIYGDGYALYTDVEKDIGSIEWLPEAVRDAARKVDCAMASNANPGFPDTTNYANPEKMLKDAKHMLDWMRVVRNDVEKRSSALPAAAISGVPDLETMKDDIDLMTGQIRIWSKDGDLHVDRGPESSDFKAVQCFTQKALAAFQAMQDCVNAVNAARNLDGTSSASANFGSSDVKTTDTVEKVKNSIQVTREAFDEVRAMMEREAEVIRQEQLQPLIDKMMTKIKEWRRLRASPANANFNSSDRRVIDECVKKLEVACEAAEKPGNEFEKTININHVLKVVQDEMDRLNAAKKADAACKADISKTSGANPEMPDLPGHPGTSRHRVERFD